MHSQAYRPEIDGLRAIAVGMVVVYHLGWGFPGGYVGVDVFFVISGFLITQILSRELAQQTFFLADFWARRIRRIGPALLVMVLVTLLAGYRWMTPDELAGLGQSASALATLVSNLYFWEETGYFAARADTKPLLHTWSLAVEEQFYLFYPLVLLGLRSATPRRRWWVLAGAALVSLAVSQYGVLAHPRGAFYLLPSRAWELMAGGLLALWGDARLRSPTPASLLSVAGLLAIVVPALTYSVETPFPGLAAMPPVCGALLLILATSHSPNLPVTRLLSSPPLVGLGLISYSLYLWHWPVIVYLNLLPDHFGRWRSVAALVISLVLAVLSWRLVETPFRRNSSWLTGPRLWCGALAAHLLILGIGLLADHTGGWVNRYNAQEKLLLDDLTWRGDEFGIAISDPLDLAVLPPKGHLPPPGERLDWLAWGDSHLRTFGPILEEFARQERQTLKIIATTGTPPLPDVCLPHHPGSTPADMLRRQDDVLTLLDRWRPRNLLLAARWSAYTDGYNATEPAAPPDKLQLTDDRKTLSLNDPSEVVLRRSLVRLQRFCQERDIALWVVKQVPETAEGDPAREIFTWAIGRNSAPSDQRVTLADHQQRQARAELVFRDPRFAGVQFIDLSPALLDEQGRVRNYQQGRALYRDSNHLTRWGLEFLKPRFHAALRQTPTGARHRSEARFERPDVDVVPSRESSAPDKPSPRQP
ncbi:MAG: acyltransferase family protein [Planctomycetaceae bacterium]|jgi:peptidoglycan/LPS O-acetylase OafA/YrhL